MDFLIWQTQGIKDHSQGYKCESQKKGKKLVVVGEWIYQANKMVKIPKKKSGYVYKRLEYVASSNLLGSQKKSLLKSQQCDAHIYTQWI